MDYAPSVYTDINVQNGNLVGGGVGATSIVPYRNKLVAAKGMLKDGKTADQRDHRRDEQHGRGHRVRRPRRAVRQPVLRGPISRRPRSGACRVARRPGTGSGGGRTRAARSALPASPITKAMPTNEGVPWPSTTATAGNQAGPNEEPYSYHPGGVNALFGDGSVRFIKDSVNLVAFRSILTIAGGDVVSSDQY